MKVLKFLFPIFILLILVVLLLSPAKYTNVAINATIVWATILLPTLFPFMFFSRLFTTFDILNNLSKPFSKLSNKLFNCPGESIYCFLLSILCGYPIGAKLTTDLYMDGKLSKGQAYRTVSFTSNCGPMFLIGSVGTGMLLSKSAGLIMFISCVFASIINGILYRKKWINFNDYYPKKIIDDNQTTISDIVFSSISSILMVGAYVIIFFILAEICISLKLFSPITFILEKFGISQQTSLGFLSGLLEITRGCSLISSCRLDYIISVPVCCFLSTFGGLSTFMQSYTFLQKLDIKPSIFLIQKTTQSIISTVLCLPLCVIFL